MLGTYHYNPHAHGDGCGGLPHDNVQGDMEKWQPMPE